VLLAISLVINTKQPLNFLFVTLALAGALLAHISVNTLNEYHDFTSGLDLVTTRTKFSGGSGALPSQPDSANLVLILGLVSLVATLAIGVFFVLEYGLAIMPIGIFGLLLIVTYTRWVNKHPLICLIAPGTGFGILMVVGSQFALTGEYLRLSWFIAAIPFCLVNNLLLLNQYPDIDADKTVGRNHFPIAYGVNRSTTVYGLFSLATITIIIVYVVVGYLPNTSLAALLPMPLMFYSWYGAVKHGAAIGSYPQYLGANVAATLLTLLVLAISIIIG
jgi:1,4-dihydroxy-2-naphthoate octaprenyltransferase